MDDIIRILTLVTAGLIFLGGVLTFLQSRLDDATTPDLKASANRYLGLSLAVFIAALLMNYFGLL